MDIPRFLNPDFSACQCCCSLSMRTRLWMLKSVYSTAHCFFLPASGALPFAALPAAVWVINSVYSTRHHGKCARGKGGPQKSHLTLFHCAGAAAAGAAAAGAALLFVAPPAALAGACWAASSLPFCPNAASSLSVSPPPQPSPPPSAEAAAAAVMVAARASFLTVSRSIISFFVSVGADGAGPSVLVRSVTYWMRTCWRSECHVQSCFRGPT